MMMCSFRTLTRALIACVCIVSFTSEAFSQTQVQLPGPWPTGWGGCLCPTGEDAFQILYNNAAIHACLINDAAMRITLGAYCTEPIFGQLGVVDSLHAHNSYSSEWFSAFAPVDATVLRSSEGDLVLSATTFAATPTHGPLPPTTASIRFGTTPSDTLSKTADYPAEIERMVIMGNGNVGIDLPPNLDGLDSAVDQIQIGGGMIPPPPPWYTGYTAPLPGLTIYGGNRFEGMMRPDTAAPYPVDYRGIAFNHYENHMTGVATRFAPMSGSGIGFADVAGGLVTMGTWPFDSSRGMHDFSGGTTLSLTGTNGLEFWSDESHKGGIQYYHMFNCWRPGFLGYGVTRNTYGLFYHYTPVYIGLDTANGTPNCDFTNLANVRPNIGDDSTWMLAVNGPALFKEAWVNATDWPDNVFLPNFQLPPLGYVEAYIREHHHLPDIPSEKEMVEHGVPLGRTEAAMTKQMEEMMLYVEQLNHKIESLEAQVQELKSQKTR